MQSEMGYDRVSVRVRQKPGKGKVYQANEIRVGRGKSPRLHPKGEIVQRPESFRVAWLLMPHKRRSMMQTGCDVERHAMQCIVDDG